MNRLFLCCGMLVTNFAFAQLSCPEKLKVVESATAPQGWKVGNSESEHAFERVSIFNGTAGGKEFELAPDGGKDSPGPKIIQTWNLKDYRSMNIFLRCRYHDTGAVLYMDAPANLQTCTLSFTLDKKGAFIGKSSLQCR